MFARSASLLPVVTAGRSAGPDITITTIHRIRTTLSHKRVGWGVADVGEPTAGVGRGETWRDPRGLPNTLAGRDVDAVPLEREEKP
jgi:hypothetical protein